MPRNMIIRLGADSSDFQKKMQQAGVISAATGAKIKNAFAAQGFSGVRAFVSEMESARKAILNVTEGMDLSKPLSEQIQQAMSARNKIATEQARISKRLKETEAMPVANTELAVARQQAKIRLLNEELSDLQNAYTSASNALESLQNAANSIGPEFLRFASHTGLQQLEAEINAVNEALESVGDKTGRSAPSVSKIAGALKQMLLWGLRLHPISAIIRRLGDQSDSSSERMEKMVQTIRNISVVSFGMKIVNALFGEMESIVGEYINQNSELQAQVDGLKSSLGQSLAPAIHLVTNALSYVLPYVVGVSNAIGQLMGALFGTGWSAATNGANKMASATGGAAKAQKEMNKQLLSFDQINKLSSQSDASSGGGGSAGSAIAPIEAKTPAWAERLKATFTELFESAEFQAANTGGKIGMILNTSIGEAASALANVDFSGAGSVLAANFNSMFGAIDWSTAGQLMGMALVALPSVAVGFIQSADWPLVGQSVSQFLMSSLGTVSEWIRSVDWLQVGTALGMFIANVDYAGIAQSLGTTLGLALGAIGATLWAMIREPWQQFGMDLRSNMELFGGDAVAGFFYTLGEGVANIGTWLWDNFCKPIIDGVKEGFGIHSPSKVFGDIGTNCVNSLADRFGEGVGNILQKISDLKTRVTNAAQTLKDAFSFEWHLPHLRLPHLSVQWDPVDNVLAQFFGVTAFPRLNIDWYAKGFITNGTSILNGIGIGERGREALLPLDSNDGWKDEIAQRISMILQNNDGGDVNATINVVLDGEKITSYFIKGLRRRSRAGTTSF